MANKEELLCSILDNVLRSSIPLVSAIDTKQYAGLYTRFHRRATKEYKKLGEYEKSDKFLGAFVGLFERRIEGDVAAGLSILKRGAMIGEREKVMKKAVDFLSQGFAYLFAGIEVLPKLMIEQQKKEWRGRPEILEISTGMAKVYSVMIRNIIDKSGSKEFVPMIIEKIKDVADNNRFFPDDAGGAFLLKVAQYYNKIE
ncbi:MAG: hypothetical protein KAK00_01930 [Nanoarchaeota archaeon]|nr:hypothetical protein [Nanoarchaeota archaeon]